jgi:8-oxo-dGTP pyrophosphatase MutT (NUDIX family)
MTDEPSPRAFTALGGETIWKGHILEVRVERFRHADGEEVQREIVRHGGAVAVVAYDDEQVWLVRQPREAVDDPDVLEIPAGRLDVAGEAPLAAAQRELAEEIGRGAHEWQPVTAFYSTVGFSNEVVHVFAATGLYEQHADSGENERIEIVAAPLKDLDRIIGEVRDSKTLIGLMWLRDHLRRATG